MEPTRTAGPQATQSTQSAQSSRGKALAQRAGEPVDASAQGGFLALLASLETTLPGNGLNGLPLEAAVDSSAADTASSLVGADPASLAAWQGLLAPGGVPGVAVPGLVATAGAGGSPGISAVVGSEWLPAPDGLVAQTALLDGAAETADAAGVTPPMGAVVGYSRMAARLQNALAQGGGVAGVLSAATAGAVQAEKKQALVMAAAAAQVNPLVVDARAMVAPGVDAGPRAGADLLGALGNVPGAPALEAFAESRVPQRSASAAGDDAGGRSSPHAAGGDWGLAHAGPPAAGVEGAAEFADAAQLGAEEQIADQVAYWVNQKTQNAEMTLDRDGQPVQVTVSLSGSEAHVTFRSDQAQTRELLDASMSQLRDLLRSEGLVLSGTTVGTSARDGTSDNDSGRRQGREGERRAQVVAAVPSAVASLHRHGGAADRAVDIFV